MGETVYTVSDLARLIGCQRSNLRRDYGWALPKAHIAGVNGVEYWTQDEVDEFVKRCRTKEGK